MKTHWFSVLNIAGIVLLTGSIFGSGWVFGSEIRWAKPANSESAAPTVTPIPAAIPTERMIESPSILQVQQTEPIPLPYTRLPVPSSAAVDHAPIPSDSPQTQQTTIDCISQIKLKSIRDISHDIRPILSDRLPEECEVDRTPYYDRNFGRTCFMWKASALSTQAAYFEDVQLERYGNTIVCPALQPVVSGAKFFGTIPILPYKMGVTPPNECVYTLGHRRPGNRVPYMVEPFPISLRGALFQAGAVAGGIYAIP